MNENANLVAAGLSIVRRNKRYVVWFYLLNLVLAWWGTSAFAATAHSSLDHSLHADKLLHGFAIVALVEMVAHPEFGPVQSSTAPAIMFAALFYLASLVFMPGVLLGYSSESRISKSEFYGAGARNTWRFVRLLLVFAIIAGVSTGILSAIVGAVVKAVDRTTPERPPFFLQLFGNILVFLVLTAIRIWFDLAQVDVVLKDQGKVRTSIARGFRWMRHNLGQLLGSYILTSLFALVILATGIVFWNTMVPPANVLGAFVIGQFMLFLLLAMRFWQRASAVAFYVRQKEAPVPVEVSPAPVLFEPVAVVPDTPPAPAEG
ncbi:MAG: hypothetical protein ABSD20_04990 [Terriglobales bacterium]|jgi:hypothetical protein